MTPSPESLRPVTVTGRPHTRRLPGWTRWPGAWAADPLRPGSWRSRRWFDARSLRANPVDAANVTEKIQAETEALRSLLFGILARSPTFLRGMLGHLNQRRAAMNDQVQATRLLEAGKRAVAAGRPSGGPQARSEPASRAVQWKSSSRWWRAPTTRTKAGVRMSKRSTYPVEPNGTISSRSVGRWPTLR